MGIVRRRARRRLLVAGGAAAYGAYRHGKNKGADEQADADAQYQDQQPPQPQQQQQQQQQQYYQAPPAPPAPAPTTGRSDVDELTRLADLHTAGTLTDAEFSAAKAQVSASSGGRRSRTRRRHA